jgi:hypothetical protein
MSGDRLAAFGRNRKDQLGINQRDVQPVRAAGVADGL